MISPLLAVARTTFTGTLRQPAFGIVVLVTLLLVAFSPAVAMFTLGHDEAFLEEFGLSTLILAGLVLGCLASSGVVRDEIERRTAQALLSKPVPRAGFLVAKFLGVAAALALAGLEFTLALMLAARQGPAETVRHQTDWPVVAAGGGAMLAALAAALALNYFRGRSFAAALVGLTAPALIGAFVLAACLDREGSWQPFGRGFDFRIARSALAGEFVIWVLAAFSVSVSVWLERGATLIATLALFSAGLVAPWLAARLRGALLLPDFGLFWAGELFYRPDATLSWEALAWSGLYALGYAVAFLALGVLGFGFRDL